MVVAVFFYGKYIICVISFYGKWGFNTRTTNIFITILSQLWHGRLCSSGEKWWVYVKVINTFIICHVRYVNQEMKTKHMLNMSVVSVDVLILMHSTIIWWQPWRIGVVLIPIFAIHFIQARLPCELNSCILLYFILLSMTQAHATYGEIEEVWFGGYGSVPFGPFA